MGISVNAIFSSIHLERTGTNIEKMNWMKELLLEYKNIAHFHKIPVIVGGGLEY